MNKKWMLAWLLIQNVACVYQSPLNIAHIKMLSVKPKQCQFLGEVEGRSIYAFTVLGQIKAKDEALIAARNLGASHLLIDTQDINFKPYVSGRAYLCP